MNVIYEIANGIAALSVIGFVVVMCLALGA